MSNRARITAGGLAAGMLAAAAGPSLAADAADAGAGSTTVDTVIVTATKRAENVQDVPISMNVTSQKQLEAFNTSDLKGLSQTIPSMMFIKTNAISAISLRGFGSGSSNPAIDQTVALYVDGIFAGRARQYMAPFFDVSRIEVLRGPQGALLGKNTAAGAISIVTNDPTDALHAAATASYLIDRKGVEAYGFVSGPVTDRLSVRLSGRYIKDDGWMRNTATGEKEPQDDSGSFRLGVKWRPTDSLSIVSKFQYDDLHVDGRSIAGFPANLTSEQAIKLTKTESGLNGATDFDRQKGKHFATTATLDLGPYTLVSVTGADAYRSRSLASASHADPVNFITNYREKFEQLSQELRLLSPAGKTFEWIVGAYVDHSDHDIDNTISYAGRFLVFNLNGQMTSYYNQTGDSISTYATGTWHVNDSLRLIGGGRWTRVHKEGDYVLARDFGQSFIGSTPFGPLQGKLTNSNFDPSITAQYDLTPRIMVYANYSKGSKGGTFQGANRAVTAATFQLEPERSTNYEAGFKAQAFDWLTFNLSAYRLEFKNLQSGQYVNGVLLTKNAGAARSQGVEFVGAADFGKLRFDASGAYDDAKYTDYPGAACTQAQINAGCVNGVTPVNAAGRPFAFVPKWSGRGAVTYSTPVADRLKLTLTAAAYYSSSYYVDAGTFNPIIGLQKAYTKVDLRVELADKDDRWSLALVGKNVGDRVTSSGVYGWPFGSPPVNVYTVDEPRSWAIQGSVKY